MQKIVMVADDLTGACDAGIQFSKKGLKSVVCFENMSVEKIDADVLIYDTDSRALPPGEAYHAVEKAMAELESAAAGLVYKKVDSTLRGNIGREIDAVMDNLSLDIAVVAPALPSLHRTTKDGRHYLNGIAIEKTEVGKDVKTPVTESDIVQLLSNQSERGAALIENSLFREDETVFHQHINDLIAEGKNLLVCDAEEENDLKEIVSRFEKLPYRMLWTGSAGLAEWIYHGDEEKESREEDGLPSDSTLPVLIVSGSRSSVTRRQLEEVRALSRIDSVSIRPEKLIDPAERKMEISSTARKVQRSVKEGSDVILEVEQGDIPSSELPRLIADALGEIAADTADSCRLQGWILTGGDTAKAVAKHMDSQGIQLLQEIEAGMPLSKMLGKKELLTVTKAGAFGTDRSLHHALMTLKGNK